jgi:membrane fusion protein (multidrug efflux system)
MKRTLVVLLCALVGASVGCEEKHVAPTAPPEVYVADVVQKDVSIFMEVVGQARGSQDVEIRARVEGYLEKVMFTEGAFVQQGTPLYLIDPKPLEATLAKAKAELASASARLEKTNNDVVRFKPLVAEQAVSQQELDNAMSARDAARAQVDAQKAAVDNAALDLGYTNIRAPISGIVGTTEVKAGNLVGRGESTLLTTISQVDPILFRAGISEAEYLRLAKRTEESKASGRAAAADIELILADGIVHHHRGRVDAVERAVDPTTGTLMIQIAFANPERVLRPGQYGRIRFESEVRKGALLVPQRAVQELQNLYSVAVVGPDNKVTFRNAKVGPRVDSLWVIEEGLKPGEKVIVEGLQKIREGSTVTAKPQPAPGGGTGAAEPAAGMEKAK